MVRRSLMLVLVVVALLAIVSSAEANSTTLEVVITSPEEGAEITDDFYIEGTAGPNGSVERVEITYDGYYWYNATGTDEWSIGVDSDALEHGPNTIVVRVWDGEVYLPNVTRNITVDNRPAITGKGCAKYLDSIYLFGSAYDDGDDLVRVEMSVDNGTWFTVNGTHEWDHEIRYEDLSNGPHAVAVRAYDGNTLSHKAYQYFDVDHRPIINVTVYEWVEDNERRIAFNGTAWDSRGIVKVIYIIDQGEPIDVNTTGEWSFEVDMDLLTPGDHGIRIQAYDGHYYSKPHYYEFRKETVWPDPDYGYVVAVVGFTAAVMLVLALLIRRYNRDR